MVERTLISLPSQLQLLERLQHHIYLSSSLIFITGETGSGKTTLTENLSNTLPPDLKQVYLSLSNVATVPVLRQKVIEQLFDRALFNAQDKLVDSVERLQEEFSQPQNRLLILDNAHLLPTDFLIELCELLASFELTEETTVNVMLLVDPASTKHFLSYLDSHLVERLSHRVNRLELVLPALTIQEATALLVHNFQQMGYEAKLQHQDALNHQLHLCAGNPKKIILLAEELSQGGFKEDKHAWAKTWLPAALLMLSLVAIVSALGVYLYPKFIPVQQPQNYVPEVAEQVLPEFETESNLQSSLISEPLAGGWSSFDLDIDDNESLVGLSDETEQRVVISNDQLIELSVLVEQPNNEMEEAPQAMQEHAIPPLLKSNTQVEAAESSVAEQLQAQIKEKSEITKQAVIENTEEVENVTTQNQPQPEITRSTDSLLTAPRVLLSKKPSNLTIQISAMSTRSYLADFKRKFGSTENVFTYQTIRNNKPLFVVVYGEYTSKASANLAIKNLPRAFAGMPTWIKSWQAVHNDLRLNNE
ncbi:AAA family ATPase [Psychromonas sp. 14N.309.X.WAT.B.A12]|uniref:AAA family ATPase n=1 Tax=Psychromonas sp. 14N.309.X.WAT.B.A12 TaxID=2998322 RepID=UPI0025AF1306|nr:AAA family ATPase [Psychromonas sp. 14N.309.X.WAT.B.A12]MDN2664036.1 AAA family ATPase [Psychromonas sp. 14N.309.X.WAT.B.A12]